MKKQWNYVEKDGNPKEPGTYWVTLIYPEWKDNKKTGRLLAEVDTRYFADLDKNPELKGWIMDSEPENGLAWTEHFIMPAGVRIRPLMMRFVLHQNRRHRFSDLTGRGETTRQICS